MRLSCKVLSCVLGCIIALSTFGQAVPIAHAANLGDVTVSANTALGQSGPDAFAGVYEYNNLTLAAGVHVTSKGISQLVLIVHGTLTINEGADIRVRNGYSGYDAAPTLPIVSITATNYQQVGISRGAYLVFPGAYGRGGNGGNGGNGGGTVVVGGSLRFGAGNGGAGGGGGYGGGNGGNGGRGGQGKPYTDAYGRSQMAFNGTDGSPGWSNGRLGGYGSGGQASGGQDLYLGDNGPMATTGGGSGGGGGGNGGRGGGSASSAYMTLGGGGGGGGGYGGGVLTIVAQRIIVNSSKPVFLVSGQMGGGGGSPTADTAQPGAKGEGGMLVINSNDYSANAAHWKSISGSGDTIPFDSTASGGHGIVVGDPQLVLINSGGAATTATPTAQPTPTLAEQPTVDVQPTVTPEPQPTPVPPGTPQVKAAAASFNSISLSWPAVAGAKSYVVYQSRSASGGFKKLTTVTKPRYVAKNLVTGVPYYYRVVAMGLNKKKPVALGTSATVTAATGLAQPAALRGKALAPNKVKLTWKKVAGATGYVVLKQVDDGSFVSIGTSSSATFTAAKLIPGQPTTFAVRAYRRSGGFRAYSPDSAAVTVNH